MQAYAFKTKSSMSGLPILFLCLRLELIFVGRNGC